MELFLLIVKYSVHVQGTFYFYPRGSVYLYPDLVTALVGRWKEDGSLVSAYPARLMSWEIINDVFIPHCNITKEIQYR